MFGRVRAASSTLDSLELERPPSKLIKDDSFSIYEATLLKLKLGSQRDLGSPPGIAMVTETACSSTSAEDFCRDASSSNCAEGNCTALNLNSSQLVSDHKEMMIDTDFASVSISPSSSDCQSTGSLQQHHSRNLSILYMFSKFRSSGQVKSSSQEENMMIENDNGSSVSISPSSGDYQSLRSPKEQLEQSCVCSFPVSQT